MDRPKCPKCEEYNWPDPQEPVEGSEFCVFHAPAEEKGVEIETFNLSIFNRIEEYVDLAQKNETKATKCIMSGIIFPGDIDFLTGVQKARLPAIDFSNAVFQEKSTFSFLSFHCYTIFNNVTFAGIADFKCSNFGYDIDYAEFKYLSFSNAVFLKETDFGGAQFNVMTDFNSTKFESTVFFVDAIINSLIDFSKTVFSGHGAFLSTKINGIVMFYKITIGVCLSITLSYGQRNSILMIDIDELSIKKILFRDVEIDLLSFKGCNFPEKLYIENDSKTNYNECRDLYRGLKQKAASEHDQPLVSKWHYREKLMALKQLKEKRGWWHIFSMTWLYHAFSGFGEKPGWAGAWLLGFVFGPLIVLALHARWQTGYSPSFDPEKVSEVFTYWLRCIPFIRQDASTMGTLGQLGAAFMQILIALQAALFGFALRNKFRR